MNSDRDTPKSCPLRVGCPIRRSRDQRSLASPPGFSQRAASFIASQCQGIHQMPFISPDPRSRPPGGRPPKKRTPEPRRAQGQAPAAASRMKTLLSDQPPCTGPMPRGTRSHKTKQPMPGARPPRSYSQIHFTLQSTPPPEGSPPAASPAASPNVAAPIGNPQRPQPGLRPNPQWWWRCLVVPRGAAPLHLSAGKAVLCRWWRRLVEAPGGGAWWR
jgi:hypothetical protein